MNPITVDNTIIRKQVQNLLEQGTYKFKKGATFEEKEEGISLQVKGLQLLKTWIDRETDPQLKKALTDTYTQKYKEIGDYLKSLEDSKKKQVVAESPDGVALYKKGAGAGGGGGGANEEAGKFKEALKEAIVTEKPDVKWTDIAGLENAKKSLQEAVILPIKYPEIFTGARKPWKGILLYGPPGIGKTYLAKACATECEGTFFSISSSDLISKYVGESEKLIKTLFQMARERKPAIIFIDEVDSLCGSRNDNENEASRRVKTEFLVQMQGVGHDDTGILVLGATNLPWGLDPAIRRRFEKRIYIPLPDKAARAFLIQHQLKTTPNSITPVQVDQLAESTNGYSGADIGILVRDAVFEPVRKLQTAKYFRKFTDNNKKLRFTPVDDKMMGQPDVEAKTMMDLNKDELYIPEVVMNDFELSLKRTKASVGQDQLKEYEDFTKNFGQEG